MRLQESSVHTTIPAEDIDRAEAFYRDKLGLKGERREGGVIVFTMRDNSHFTLFKSSGSASGSHTQMGFQVRDIRAAVDALIERGVTFEEYDMPDFKTDRGVVTMDVGGAAWFRDSEGNLLGLVQLKEPF